MTLLVIVGRYATKDVTYSISTCHGNVKKLTVWANKDSLTWPVAQTIPGVPLDKSEGSVKGIVILGGAKAPLVSPERLRTKTLEISP